MINIRMLGLGVVVLIIIVVVILNLTAELFNYERDQKSRFYQLVN